MNLQHERTIDAEDKNAFPVPHIEERGAVGRAKVRMRPGTHPILDVALTYGHCTHNMSTVLKPPKSSGIEKLTQYLGMSDCLMHTRQMTQHVVL